MSEENGSRLGCSVAEIKRGDDPYAVFIDTKTHNTFCNSKHAKVCAMFIESSYISFEYEEGEICEVDAYGGDLSCDFESSSWYKGHCNWHQTIMSTKRLERVYQPPPDPSKETRQRWRLGEYEYLWHRMIIDFRQFHKYKYQSISMDSHTLDTP